MTLVSNTHEALNKHGTIKRETEQKAERGDASPQIHFPLAPFTRREI